MKMWFARLRKIMLGEDFGIAKNPLTYLPSSDLVLPSCMLGLEFEFEKVRDQIESTRPEWSVWHLARDGSLHDDGIEFKFKDPLFGADALTAIRNLVAHADKKKYSISRRTGLHVHVDMRDVMQKDLERMCVLYALFERALYRYVGRDRDENVFCLPWYAAHAIVMAIKQLINAPTPAIMRSLAAHMNAQKYAGLNLDCLARFGTLEFRHALVSKDYDWIVEWINICLSLKKAAVEMGLDVTDYFDFVKDGKILNLAERVFGSKLLAKITYPEFESEVLDYGLGTAVELFRAPRTPKSLVYDPKFNWLLPEEMSNKEIKNPVFAAAAEEAAKAKKDPQSDVEPWSQTLRWANEFNADVNAALQVEDGRLTLGRVTT